jgi:hypothetical protein
MTKEYGKELLQEENIIDILDLLKVKLSELLNEAEFDEKKVDSYLRITAIFEQFFRFVETHHIKLSEIVGINAFINDHKVSTEIPGVLEKRMNIIIDHFSKNRAVNFKHITESRFQQFKKWYDSKKKEDLQIIQDAVIFITKTIATHKHELSAEHK